MTANASDSVDPVARDMRDRRLAALAAILAGLALACLALSPVLAALGAKGLAWPIRSAHHEGVTLTTYGKWLARPPHHFMVDACSGEFPTFYNWLSDAILNAIAALGGWPPMVVQVVIYGPLLAGIFFWANWLSLSAVFEDRRLALLASLIISLGTNSGLTGWIDPGYDRFLNEYVHTPFHALPLGTAQSLGWVLFLPALSLLYLAYGAFSRQRAVAYGLCLGVLFHVHTLSFIHVSVVQLVYLVLTNACRGGGRSRSFKVLAFVLSLAPVVLVVREASGRPISVKGVAALVGAALFVTFLLDPAKELYLWTFGVTALLASPFLLRLARYARASTETPEKGVVIGLGGLALFFSVYWLAAAAAFLKRRRQPGLIWAVAMLSATLLLAFNHIWGWGNHPYRFAINLIFPLGILAAIGLQRAPRWLAVSLGIWMAGLFAGGTVRFLTGPRSYVNVVAGKPGEAEFLNRLRDLTAAERPGEAKILTPTEFDYPHGLLQTALILNYSEIPGFVPDYRYIVWRERYRNRMGLFCFLFPKYPNRDAHFDTRACQERLEPSANFALIKEPKLRAQVLPVYAIRWAAALGEPFADSLRIASAAYGWHTVLALHNGRTLTRLDPAPLPGVATFHSGTSGPSGMSVDFDAQEPGRHVILLGGRQLAGRVDRILIDSRPVMQAVWDENWAVAVAELREKRHRLELPWRATAGDQDRDYLYFASVVHEAWARDYLASPHLASR